MVKAKKWVLAKQFDGSPKESNFKLVEEDLGPLEDGGFIAEAICLSLDPYMRAYSAMVTEGNTMLGTQIAKVTESKNSAFPVGCLVLGTYGWQTATLVSKPDEADAFTGHPNSAKMEHLDDSPATFGLGLLGMTGATAYFGFLELCRPQAGEVVLVNGAAGAVGSVVGQIAKIKGCKVIGYAGSDDKCKWLKELGFDYAFNYKTCDLGKTLKEAAPDGIDCYFDNVGGEFSDTVVSNHLKLFGRMACCGAISSYNAGGSPKGDQLYMNIVGKQLSINGFIVHRWGKRFPEAHKEIKGWYKEGKVKYQEHITEGFENMPKAFIGMMNGENTGKAVVKV